MNSEHNLLAIKETALQSGLPASTLRYYEDIGLIGPVDRDGTSGHRRYSATDVTLATAIACLSATGMSIASIRTYLANRQHGVDGAEAQLELLEGERRRLHREAAAVRLRERYVTAKVAYWRAVIDRDAAAQQALRQDVDRLAHQLHPSKAGDDQASEISG